MESLPHPTFDRRMNHAFAVGCAVFAVSFGMLFCLGNEERAGWAEVASSLTCIASLPVMFAFMRDRASCPRCGSPLTRPDLAPAFVCQPCGVEWTSQWQCGG